MAITGRTLQHVAFCQSSPALVELQRNVALRSTPLRKPRLSTKEHTVNLRTRSRRSLRSRLHKARRMQPAAPVLPLQRSKDEDAYTWAVNAAVESGDTELAYELAAGYRP